MTVTIGVRWQGKTQSLALGDSPTVGDLQEGVEQRCGVPRNRQQLKGGFPPKPIDLSQSADTKLADIGLNHRDSVVLTEVEPPPDASQASEASQAGSLPPDCPPMPERTCKVLTEEAVGDLERFVIPADNSCLFSSILTPLQLTAKMKPMDLRKAVRAHILASPAELDAECQADSGKDSLAYADWIVKPDSWGGFIDLHILSGYLGVQICAICIRTLRVESFPNEPKGDARIFLLFDGIHYDTVTVAAPDKAGLFSTKDDFTLSKAMALALDLQEKKQFTDTAHFTLQCQHCFKLLTGEADAQKHAKETGHFNFQEAPGK